MNFDTDEFKKDLKKNKWDGIALIYIMIMIAVLYILIETKP